MQIKTKKAFSVAEALIFLLIVNLIIGASIPLINHNKFNSNSYASQEIQSCNNGNFSACKYAYANNLNHSCTQVLSTWAGAPTGGNYTIFSGAAPNGPPITNATNIACNFTGTIPAASASISGCDAGNLVDCTYANINGYNQGCNQIASYWSGAGAGNHNLTSTGGSTPISTNCSNLNNPQIAAIIGCDLNTDISGNSTGKNANLNDCAYGYNNNANKKLTGPLPPLKRMSENHPATILPKKPPTSKAAITVPAFVEFIYPFFSIKYGIVQSFITIRTIYTKK